MRHKCKTTMWFLAVPLAVFMAGCNNNDHNDATAATDTTPPTVLSTIPAAGASGVPINRHITATFNEPMNPATITATIFTVTHGGTAVTGVVTYVGNVATFDPSGNLVASTLCAATVTTGAKDQAGNALATDRTWSFTTGTTADNTAPTV